MSKYTKKDAISVAELAKLIGISRVAVFNKIKKGQIRAQKVGRAYVIQLEDVQHLLPSKGEHILSEESKRDIIHAVEKVVKDYGEALKLLGKE